jgi:chromosome segregation ATPase
VRVTARDAQVPVPRHPTTAPIPANPRPTRVAWRLLTPGGTLSRRQAPMQPSDLTIAILKGIREDIQGVRDEVQGVRDEVQGVRDELRITNTRIDRLDRRQVDAEVRVATELLALTNTMRDVRDLLREDRGVHDRVDDHERRIGVIEGRLG